MGKSDWASRLGGRHHTTREVAALVGIRKRRPAAANKKYETFEPGPQRPGYPLGKTNLLQFNYFAIQNHHVFGGVNLGE